MIEELIEELENDEDAILMHPVASQSLSRTQSFLSSRGCPRLPEDYIDFLHASNGLAFKDIRFFGTTSVEEEHMPDLASANEKFQEKYENGNLLLIGQGGHDLFVYNKETSLYEIVDKNNLEMIEEFEEFFDLIAEFCGFDDSFDDDDDYTFEEDYED